MGLVNQSFLSLFPSAGLSHLSAIFSDHHPVLLRFSASTTQRRRSRLGFKFEAMWVRHSDCVKVVESNWEEGADFAAASAQCRLGLAQWGSSQFGSVKGRIKQVQKQLHKLQEGLVTVDVKAHIQSAKRELEELLEYENLMWKQRSKTLWTKDGDRNTRFFQQQASKRAAKNDIAGLKNDLGELVTDIQVLKYMVSKVSPELNQELCQPYSSDEEDVEEILKIPLSNASNIDTHVWHYTKSGCYSVKSAYRLAMDLKHRRSSRLAGSSSTSVGKNWNFLWNLKLPGKIKIFLWRVLHCILPTHGELQRRHLLVDSKCDICDVDYENILHALRDCHFARQVWALSNLPFSVIFLSHSTLWDWIWGVKLRLDTQDFELFVVVCWCLWYNRNKYGMEDWTSDPLKTWEFVNSFIQFQRWNSAAPISQFFDMDVSVLGPWERPPAGVVKINYDAAVPHSDAACGIDAVCRDFTGLVLAWQRCKIAARTPVDSAELQAAKLGVELALSMGFTKVILEGDSLQTVKDIKYYSPSLAVHSNALAVVCSALSQFESVKIVHVRREANQLAHELCHNFVMDARGYTELPFHFIEPG